MKTLSLTDAQALVGQEVGTSGWLEVTQDNINAFAKLTHDEQFIHVDPELAAKTPFGTTIAHGFYSLSMLSFFSMDGCGLNVEGAKMGLNYGCDKVRFIEPVKIGDKIRGHSQLQSINEKNPGQFLVKMLITVQIEGKEKPALIAEWLTMIVV